ncbi:MAG: hypothetical protein ACE5FZ_09095 [Nitrospiria bacterium]
MHDSYGGILSSTLSVTLTSALAGSGDVPDPTTRLVYLGQGRYYDPALGRPLQPSSVEGVPIVPQSLNRYAATPLGQPGVVVNVPGFANLSLATGFVKNVAFETLGRTTWGPFGYAQTRILQEAYTEVSVTASHTAISRSAREIRALGGDLLDPSVGLGRPGSGKYTRVFKLGRGLTTVDDLIREANLPTKGGWRATVVINNFDEVAKTSRFPRLSLLRQPIIGFGADAVLGFAFQYYEDSYNPYLAWYQRLARAGTSGVGGAATAILFVSLVCGPEAPLCAVGMATLGSVTWIYLGQPIIFETIPYFQPPPRRLQPLE